MIRKQFIDIYGHLRLLYSGAIVSFGEKYAFTKYFNIFLNALILIPHLL